MKLGSFGAAVREYEQDGERDTFDFFGETFTVEGVIPSIVLLKVAAAMVGQLGAVEGDAAMYESLRFALTKPGATPDDKPDRTQWERFYYLAASRKGSPEALTGLVLALMGAQSGKDLEPQPGSPDGSPQPSTSSNSSSSDTPDSHGMIPVDQLLDGSTP